MKKDFVIPELIIIYFNEEDIITESGDKIITGEGDMD